VARIVESLTEPQTARARMRAGSGFEAEASVTISPLGLLAVGGMVGAILLAVVPIVRFPIAPGPVARTKGIRPAMNAKDVITIGLNRNLAPSIPASLMLSPSWLRWTANSMIKIAFLPKRPTSITRPIWQ